MSDLTQDLQRAQADLGGKGCELSMVRRFAGIIPDVQESMLEETLAEFHNIAGQMPYWEDCDVGALILESVADSMASGSRRAAIYRHAKYRTQWCASGATAGGEGIARSAHLARVMRKLSDELGPGSVDSEETP